MTARPGDIERLLKNRWDRGKSCHKYNYTVQDIAKVTGRAVGTVRNDINKGKLKMGSLLSVSNYVCRLKSRGR